MIEIIQVFNKNDITVRFDDGYIKYNCLYCNFKSGTLRNPYYPSVEGVGYIGEETCTKGYALRSSSKYNCWRDMIRRCYNKKYQETHPSYADCEVDKRWHNYEVFSKWYDENCYEINGKKTHLDKDILFKGNKIYSPETCVFVPRKINNVILNRKRCRGVLPLGVIVNKHGYGFSCRDENGGNITGDGYANEVDAFNAYKIEKEGVIKRVAGLFKDTIPKKLYLALLEYPIEITD